jgi:ribosome modulation factor
VGSSNRLRLNDVRHDRIPEGDVKAYRCGGNAIMFGLWGVIEDLPTGDAPSRHHMWNAYNCGYQAYRQGKVFGANPYYNDVLEERWSAGWKDARKACTTGKGPFDH